jgi:hypothetical protein
MEYYTRFHLAVELKRKTPADVLKILGELLPDNAPPQPVTTAEHPFFECGRWTYALRCTAGGPHPLSTLKPAGEHGSLAAVLIDAEAKAYDDEFTKFLDWLKPWIYTRGFIGYIYGEDDSTPTLIFNHEGNIAYTAGTPPA